MSRDLQCLDSTPIDSPELRSSQPQPLNRALTYVAQEVSGLLLQSHLFSVNRDNNSVETISIRAIEPEYKFIISTPY